MDAVDVSDHYVVTTADETPSLLSIVIDTNPRAWAALDDRLPLAKAVANLLVFANAHLAFSAANQVAVVAAHLGRALWLYPQPAPAPTASAEDASGDVLMEDAPSAGNPPPPAPASANKYPPFAHIEATVMSSMRRLIASTPPDLLLDAAATSQLSGALTLALCHINKAAQGLMATASHLTDTSQPVAAPLPPVKARIVVLSVSDSDPAQYIPTMNAVFAAAHAQVAIDTLSLTGDPAFLQQACFNTGGTFLRASNPQGLLTYLMFGLIADPEARRSLIAPTHDTVDFRAACFCHGNVIDAGFVCSVCLSIFCEPPEKAVCLTCATALTLGDYGAKPAVVSRKKKRKKRVVNGRLREETDSAAGTPRP